jgi:hypothetical protein
LTRQQALDLLEAVGGDEAEWLLGQVRAGPAVLSPALEARVEQVVSAAHIRTSYFSAREEVPSRPRRRRQPVKYPWER